MHRKAAKQSQHVTRDNSASMADSAPSVQIVRGATGAAGAQPVPPVRESRSTIPIRLDRGIVSRLYQKVSSSGGSLQETLETELIKAEKYDKLKSKDQPVEIDASQGVEALKRMLETERIATEIHQLREMRRGSPQNSAPVIADNGSKILEAYKLGQECHPSAEMMQKFFEERVRRELAEHERDVLKTFHSQPATSSGSLDSLVDDATKQAIREKVSESIKTALDGSSGQTPPPWFARLIKQGLDVAGQVAEKAQLAIPRERYIQQIITPEQAASMIASGQVRPEQVVFNQTQQPQQQESRGAFDKLVDPQLKKKSRGEMRNESK